MSISEELHLLHQRDYFTILSVSESSYEIMSNNTGHCWRLNKEHEGRLSFISLYHKHHIEDSWHYQTDCLNVLETLIYVADHDEYQLRGRKPYRGKNPENSFYGFLLSKY